jgi:ferredoxin
MAVSRPRPTYARDVVGEIRRYDPRDHVFARADLHQRYGPDSPEFAAYYARHPDLLEIDTKTHAMPGLGHTGGIDTAMFEAQFAAINLLRSNAVVDGPPAPLPVELPPARAAVKVKALARHLGADLVGIGPLRQRWVYSHVGRGPRRGAPIDLHHHHTAIALGLRMDYDLLQSAPHFPVLLATAKGYATGAWVSVQLATYLRKLGYSARAHHLRNYQVLCVPVAVDCGLGELSRAGFLLTRELGLALRLAIVTTDMPLAHDPPRDIGVQSFCEQCKLCADACKIGAIPSGDKVEVNGVRRWILDAEACYRYWHAMGTDCGACMAACPWTQPATPFHRLMGHLATVKGPHQRWMVWAHKLLYGKFKSAPPPAFMEGSGKEDGGRRKEEGGRGSRE